jgi:hypothetical protein
MEIIDARTLLVGAKIKFMDNQEMQEALTMGIQALDKQIPKEPIIESWSPALCPSCGAELSELIGDGYYKHHYGQTICECGQKLKWDNEV